MKTVKIKFSETSAYFKSGAKEETLENITEVHYNYDRNGRIAFESDTDGTGYTYALSDIAEFETT